jgi:hypothetical protein
MLQLCDARCWELKLKSQHMVVSFINSFFFPGNGSVLKHISYLVMSVSCTHLVTTVTKKKMLLGSMAQNVIQCCWNLLCGIRRFCLVVVGLCGFVCLFFIPNLTGGMHCAVFFCSVHPKRKKKC